MLAVASRIDHGPAPPSRSGQCAPASDRCRPPHATAAAAVAPSASLAAPAMSVATAVRPPVADVPAKPPLSGTGTATSASATAAPSTLPPPGILGMPPLPPVADIAPAPGAVSPAGTPLAPASTDSVKTTALVAPSRARAMRPPPPPSATPADLAATPELSPAHGQDWSAVTLRYVSNADGVPTIPAPGTRAFALLYATKHVLGSGSMGEVFLAQHRLTRHPVALKRITRLGLTAALALFEDEWADDRRRGTRAAAATIGEDPRYCERARVAVAARTLWVMREFALTTILRHPNIAQSYQAHQDADFYYLSMRAYPGHDLLEHLNRHARFSEPRARTVFGQIADAVAYLHANHVAHRDIKPENIVYDVSTTRAVLIDFDQAVFFVRDTPLTDFAGTTLYSPPEVLAQRPYDAPASDVWSLGVTLYVMTHANHPWDHDDNAVLAQRIQSDNFPVPSHFSGALTQLLTGMLTKDPAARWTLDDVCQSAWLAKRKRAPATTPSTTAKSAAAAAAVGHDPAASAPMPPIRFTAAFAAHQVQQNFAGQLHALQAALLDGGAAAAKSGPAPSPLPAVAASHAEAPHGGSKAWRSLTARVQHRSSSSSGHASPRASPRASPASPASPVLPTAGSLAAWQVPSQSRSTSAVDGLSEAQEAAAPVTAAMPTAAAGAHAPHPQDPHDHHEHGTSVINKLFASFRHKTHAARRALRPDHHHHHHTPVGRQRDDSPAPHTLPRMHPASAPTLIAASAPCDAVETALVGFPESSDPLVNRPPLTSAVSRPPFLGTTTHGPSAAASPPSASAAAAPVAGSLNVLTAAGIGNTLPRVSASATTAPGPPPLATCAAQLGSAAAATGGIIRSPDPQPLPVGLSLRT